MIALSADVSCRPRGSSTGNLIRYPSPVFFIHSWWMQSALFNLVDLITVILLMICICTYIRGYRKRIFDVEDGTHHGFRGELYEAIQQCLQDVNEAACSMGELGIGTRFQFLY